LPTENSQWNAAITTNRGVCFEISYRFTLDEVEWGARYLIIGLVVIYTHD
jgi:hypothetical protein